MMDGMERAMLANLAWTRLTEQLNEKSVHMNKGLSPSLSTITLGEISDEHLHHNRHAHLSYNHDRISNSSLCKVALEVGLVERTVDTTPVVLIECFLDSWADSVVVDHIKVATQGVRELEFMVGREHGEVFDLQRGRPVSMCFASHCYSWNLEIEDSGLPWSIMSVMREKRYLRHLHSFLQP